MPRGIIVEESPREIRRLALTALNGAWGKVLICYLIYQSFVSFIPNAIALIVPGMVKTVAFDYLGTKQELSYTYLPVIAIAILGGAFELSMKKIYLRLLRERTVDIKDIFFGFSHFIKAFVTQLLIWLSVIVLTLPLVLITGLLGGYLIGGGGFFAVIGSVLSTIAGIATIIIAILLILLLSMSLYILADNPSLKPATVIKTSVDIMRKNTGRLFILRLSYIGWGLLSIMMSSSITSIVTMYFPNATLLAGILSSIPIALLTIYMEMGDTFFYEFATGHLRKTGSVQRMSASPNDFNRT